MKKAYSEIIGLPVSVEGVGKITRVTDILIDTTNGSIIAFFVSSGKMKIIVPVDILYFGRSLVIRSVDDVIDAQDVIKVRDILQNGIKIIKSRVETKKGEYLGHVFDYIVDTNLYSLSKIIVHKSFLGIFKTPDRLIPAQDIIEIKKGLIIVKDKYALKFVDTAAKRYPNLYPDVAS